MKSNAKKILKGLKVTQLAMQADLLHIAQAKLLHNDEKSCGRALYVAIDNSKDWFKVYPTHSTVAETGEEIFLDVYRVRDGIEKGMTYFKKGDMDDALNFVRNSIEFRGFAYDAFNGYDEKLFGYKPVVIKGEDKYEKKDRLCEQQFGVVFRDFERSLFGWGT